MQVTANMITGKTREHLARLDADCQLHIDVIQPFHAMQQAAAEQGIALQVASGFRSYERQLAIWNAKASGERVVFGGQGEVLDTSSMSDTDLMSAILHWSAIPGCSRHHWGTDMDVWDAAAVSADYSLQLIPEEYAGNGPFAALNTWLDIHAERFGFTRPYEIDTGGVAPEPWHLSYFPVARQFERQLDITFVRKILDNKTLALRDCLINHLDEIFPRYIGPSTPGS